VRCARDDRFKVGLDRTPQFASLFAMRAARHRSAERPQLHRQLTRDGNLRRREYYTLHPGPQLHKLTVRSGTWEEGFSHTRGKMERRLLSDQGQELEHPESDTRLLCIALIYSGGFQSGRSPAEGLGASMLSEICVYVVLISRLRGKTHGLIRELTTNSFC